MKKHSIFKILGLLCALTTFNCSAQDEEPISSQLSETTMRGQFELWQTERGDWYFDLLAGNYESLLYSEGYSSRTAALNGILSVLSNGGTESRYTIKEGRDGQYYLSLRARNGKIIATSEGYVSASNASRAINACNRAVEGYLAYWNDHSGARIQVSQGNSSTYRFNVHAGNGEVVLTSESYKSKASALNGAFSVVENGVDEDAYEIAESSSGGFYINLRAANHQVIATSEVYASRDNAERARDSMMSLLPTIDLI